MSPPSSQADYVAMVLAAGRGSRLAPLTEKSPKPLAPFFDAPLIEYAVARLRPLRPARLVVNVHHHRELMEEYLGGLRTRLLPELELVVSPEEELLGTGGGIAQARKFFDDKPVVVVNSDLYFDFDLAELVARHEATGAEITALLHSGEGYAHLRSTAVDARGRITAITPAAQADRSCGIFAGAYVLEPEAWRRLPQGFGSVIDGTFRPAIAAGARVEALKRTFPWLDLGTWDDYYRGTMAVIGALTGNGCGFPEVARLSPGHFAPGAGDRAGHYLGPGAVARTDDLGPGAVVGSRAIIEPGARVERSVVLPGAIVPRALADSVCGHGWRWCARAQKIVEQ